jgi:FERM, RhoGEF and pleckstrin domain protein 2
MTNSRMTHSLSTPSGVDGASSAASRTGGKKLAIRVQMLDDSMTLFQVQACDIIFTRICANIDTSFLGKSTRQSSFRAGL